MKNIAEYIANDKNFIKYAFSTDEDHTYMIWRTKLNEAAEYLEHNLYEDYMTTYWRQLLASDITKISKDYIQETDNGTLYPYYVNVLKSAAKLMLYSIEHTGVPFISYIEKNGHKSIDKYISYSENIKLPAGAIAIEPGALRYCFNMKQLEIPEGIRYIPRLMDVDRTYLLEKVVFPTSAEAIENAAFFWCENLEEVIFKGNNTRFSSDAFYKSLWFKNLDEGMLIQAGTLFFYDFDEEDVVIPEGVKYIAPYVFRGKSMKTLQLPKSLQKIAKGAFESCEKLEKLIIPENVTEIADEAFRWCNNLTEIHLPKNIEFESRSFLDCKNATVYCHRDTESVKILEEIGQVKIKYID